MPTNIPQPSSLIPPLIVAETTIMDASNGRVVNDLKVESGPPIPAGFDPSAVEFEAYCTVRSIPPDHRKGMRSFTDRKVATVEEWDAIFATY